MSHSKPSPLNLTPGKNNSLPRNSFDVGYHSMFTSPAGLILPTYVQDVKEGSYLNLNVANHTRTMPVNTAAFSRLKEVTDFYFVPYRLLWRYFDQFYTGVNDISTAYSAQTGVPSQTPYITLQNMIDWLSAGGFDSQGFPVAKGRERIFDLLGYPVSNDSAVTTLSMYNAIKTTGIAGGKTLPTFNPFRLLAYQRIFMDFYRNSDYTAYDPKSFNIDNTAGGAAVNSANLGTMCEPRYAQWKKDRFTSVKPTPLSMMENQLIDSVAGKPEGQVNASSNNIIRSSGSTSLKTVASTPTSVNLSQLRASLAYDRLARLTMLSPKTYRAQLKAQFGVEPDNCDYCSAKYLGSYDTSINIGEVTSTAAGETTSGSKSVLGQLAGKGWSQNERNGIIKASFSEPGIVMGMHYIQPFSEYDSNRIDDFNRKLNRNDYHMPNYDNLGLQPLIGATVGMQLDSYGNINDVMAYQARYMEYKTRIDEVHGQFQSKQPLSAWCMPRNATTPVGLGLLENNLYVSPKITDTLFALAYDGSQVSDPFLCHYRYDATIVNNMSILGLPSM